VAFFVGITYLYLMGFFTKSSEPLQSGIAKTKLAWTQRLKKTLLGRSSIDDDLLEELEEVLLTSDVGAATTEKIMDRLTKRVSKDKYLKVEELDKLLYKEMSVLLKASDAAKVTSVDGLHVILVVGVNGAGKTTTIGKLAKQYTNQGKRVLLAAADTFRAGAIEQLRLWSERVSVPLVALDEGSDPASVAYTAMMHAQKEGVDVLLIDTAGRLHNNVNLMQELSKIKRVVQKVIPEAPHEVLLVLDGGTGQNAFAQAKEFSQATSVTGLVLTKLDGTAKGGVVIGISDELEVPIQYIGIGEGVNDLIPFDVHAFLDSLFKNDS